MVIMRSEAGEAVTAFMLDLFRLNNRLLSTGDRLVAHLGLTSARWQVLGAIVAADRPQPVAWLARDLGANRQNVQRIVNDMRAGGLVRLEPNPHHRRAHLVALTAAGQAAYEGAMERQAPWMENLVEDVRPGDLEAAQRVIAALLQKVEDTGS